MSEKLQKVLARAGLGSRRTIEAWIQAGRVSVNGEIAKLGARVTPSALIKVDGNPVPSKNLLAEATQVLLYHKPIGEVCTRRDPEGRPSVFIHLPKLSVGRWINVGRLDVNTSGLLLFTNNGGLAHQLMHPSFQVEREYAVRVYGKVGDAILSKLMHGVELEDGRAKFNAIYAMQGEGKNQWYRVVLTEGRNRIVRRLWQSQGIKVNRLMRIRFGPIPLPRNLSPGNWLALSSREISSLLANSKSESGRKRPIETSSDKRNRF